MGRRGSSTSEGHSGGAAETSTLRLDKWIWFARFQRARETCAELVRKGHVRLNGRRITQPGAVVRVGDILTLALPGETRVIEVIALAGRREGSAVAATLYRTLENPSGPRVNND
jgi:ribosome-associated heat shock protein Hsp15